MIKINPSDQSPFLLLPDHLLKPVITRVHSWRSLINLGMTCKTLHTRIWKALIEMHDIRLSLRESPNAGFKSYLKEFVDCFYDMAKTVHLFSDKIPRLRLFKYIEAIPTLTERQAYCYKYLQENPNSKGFVLNAAIESNCGAVAENVLRSGNFDVFEKFGIDQFLLAAVRKGNLQITDAICLHAKHLTSQLEAAFLAALLEDNEHIIHYFLKNLTFSEPTLRRAQFIAIIEGKTEIFKLLCRDEKLFEDVLELMTAILDKNKEIEKSFIRRKETDFRLFAYAYATLLGDIAVMERFYTKETLPDDCLREVIYFAARSGNQILMQYYLQNFSKRKTFKEIETVAMTFAIWKGQSMALSRLVMSHRTIDFRVFRVAAGIGYHPLFTTYGSFIAQMSGSQVEGVAMIAAQKGSALILKQLYQNVSEKVYRDLFLVAASRGYLDCVKELLEWRPLDTETKIIGVAVARIGRFNETMEFISKSMTQGRVFFVKLRVKS